MSARLALLFASALLLVAGCGGSDEPETRATPTAEAATPRQQLIAQGDAICTRANEEIAAINERISRIESSAQSADEVLSQAAPILADGYAEQRAHVAEFRELEPPAADAAVFEEMVAAFERQVALVGRLARVANARDVPRMQSVGDQLEANRERVRGLFQGYGFKECGSGSEG